MSSSSGPADLAEAAVGVVRVPDSVDPIGDVRRSLAVLVDADIAGLADGESVLAVLECQSVLEAVACRQAAAFDLTGEWPSVGAKNSPAWVSTESRGESRRVKRRLRVGTWLRSMTHTQQAFDAGRIGLDHVDLLVRARSNRGTAERFGDDEKMLVAWACSLTFAQFRAVLAEWTIHADLDGAEARAERDHDNRHVHLSQSLDGQWFLDGLLDPISGDIVNTVLSGIERELFEADWAAATGRLGHQPTVADLDRRSSQRRADALVEMASRAAAMPAGARQPKPLFTVLVGEESFARTCVLASGTVIAPGTASRWLMNAEIERVVFEAPDRVIAVSQRRLFAGAMRRAVEVRDRSCTHRYCDEPVDRCQADHVRPWAQGGMTSIDNGRLRCGFHNRLDSGPPGRADQAGDSS